VATFFFGFYYYLWLLLVLVNGLHQPLYWPFQIQQTTITDLVMVRELLHWKYQNISTKIHNRKFIPPKSWSVPGNSSSSVSSFQSPTSLSHSLHGKDSWNRPILRDWEQPVHYFEQLRYLQALTSHLVTVELPTCVVRSPEVWFLWLFEWEKRLKGTPSFVDLPTEMCFRIWILGLKTFSIVVYSLLPHFFCGLGQQKYGRREYSFASISNSRVHIVHSCRFLLKLFRSTL